MKFSAAFLLASMASVAMADKYAVHMKVECKGMKGVVLSDEEKKFSSEALLLAYNQAHELADDGDIYMSTVKWEPKPDTALFSSEGQLTQWLGDYDYYYGNGECRFCSDDWDDNLDDPNWTGIWDDDKAMIEGEVNHKKKKHKVDKAVEKFYVEKLHESDFTTFLDVKKCDIDVVKEEKYLDVVDDAEMEVIKMAEVVTEVVADKSHYHKGFVKAECKGLGKLTLKEEQFIAKTLEDTYNALHEEMGDGMRLSNTHWEGERGTTDNEQAEVENYCEICYLTSWDCRFCSDDWDDNLDDPNWTGIWDDDNKVEGEQIKDVYETFFRRSGLRKKKKKESKELKQWTALFEAAIVEGDSFFQKAKKCTIEMMLSEDPEEENPAVQKA